MFITWGVLDAGMLLTILWMRGNKRVHCFNNRFFLHMCYIHVHITYTHTHTTHLQGVRRDKERINKEIRKIRPNTQDIEFRIAQTQIVISSFTFISVTGKFHTCHHFHRDSDQHQLAVCVLCRQVMALTF